LQDNFLAMCASAALVGYFIVSVGVQINNKALGSPLYPLLDQNGLTAALYITTFIIFLILLLTFAVESWRSWRAERDAMRSARPSVARSA
jgi:hypothetical protein